MVAAADREQGGRFGSHKEAFVDLGGTPCANPFHAFFLYDLKLLLVAAHPSLQAGGLPQHDCSQLRLERV